MRDEFGELLGVAPQAFALRPEKRENYLSTSFFEFIDGSTNERLKFIREIWIKLNLGVKPEVGMAICKVEQIKGAGIDRKTPLTVRLEGTNINPSYTKVFGLPLDNSDQTLLELLAADSVVEVHLIKLLKP